MNRRELLTCAAGTIPTFTLRNDWGSWGEKNPPGERIVMIAANDIIHAFAGPHQVIAAKINGVDLPADVTVRIVAFDYGRDVFVIRCQSREWKPVPLGEVTPVLEGLAKPAYQILTKRPDGLYQASDL